MNRLTRVSGILQKGHKAHESLRLVYILIPLIAVIAIIIIAELFFWNRRVRNLNKQKKRTKKLSFFIII